MTEAVAPGTAASHLTPLRLLSDERLMRLAADGDRRAFGAIYRRYHQELYRYCLAIVRSPEDATDALQSTMLNALRSLPGERRQIALKPWLYRVAHNEAVTLVRQRGALAPLEQDSEPEAPSANQQAEARLRLRELVADLETLPDRQRGALVMRELSGLSYSEIGSAFGTSSSAAKQTVYEARAALHEIGEGRAMECEAVRQALSAADGRVLRGRKLRAHLRHCGGCRDFRAAIGHRRSELAALAPPLPAAAAAGLLQGLVGGNGAGVGGGAAGLLGAGGAKTLASSGVLKVAAAVIATAAVGVGTAEVTGVAHDPFSGSSGSSTSRSPVPGAAPQTTSASQGAIESNGGGTPSTANGNGGHPDKAGNHGKSGTAGNSHAGSSKPAGSPSAHGGGPPSGAGGGRTFGQQQAQSHAPQLPPQAQSHPAPPAQPTSPPGKPAPQVGPTPQAGVQPGAAAATPADKSVSSGKP